MSPVHVLIFRREVIFEVTSMDPFHSYNYVPSELDFCVLFVKMVHVCFESDLCTCWYLPLRRILLLATLPAGAAGMPDVMIA